MDALYHYCSTASFHAIVASKAIWLSALSLSNDTKEGKLIAASVRRLAERDKLAPDTTRRLIESIEHLEQLTEGLGFCLSEEGDLLSQWRGYAENAAGVAIGFSRPYLHWLRQKMLDQNEDSFGLNKVVYEAEEQDQLVNPTYEKAKTFINDGAYEPAFRLGLLDIASDEGAAQRRRDRERAFRKLMMTLVRLFPQLYLLKASAFREEREWRLISNYFRTGDVCLYRATRGSIIPYREFKLLEGEEPALLEVVLGPKHLTPIHLVEAFLDQSGFKDVAVRRSVASYR